MISCKEMKRRLARSNDQFSKVRFFSKEIRWVVRLVFCRHGIRATRMRIEEFLHGFGIALRYPMTDLPAQCEAVGENTALHLLDFLDEKISSFLLIRNELEELKVDAQELQRFWFGWALDETLVEMDVLIEPLQDVRQVLNSLYGPERVTIDSLNHKIRDSLSV